MAYGYRIIDIHRCAVIAGAHNNRMVSVRYGTFIAKNKRSCRVSYIIFRTDYGCIFNLIRCIINTHGKVIGAFITTSTRDRVVHTDYGCTQCIVGLITTAESHGSTAALRVFNSTTQVIS